MSMSGFSDAAFGSFNPNSVLSNIQYFENLY